MNLSGSLLVQPVQLRTPAVPVLGTDPESQTNESPVIMDTVVSVFQAVILVSALAGVLQQNGPPNAAMSPGPGVQDANQSIKLPVSLERIQQALSRPPAIKPSTTRPVFRVEVFARKPTVADILGPDYLRGPVPAGGMTHREFLNMVTPVEFRGMSVFTGGEALTVAATSLALQWALMKAVDRLQDARTERAKEAARREVIQAMNELEEARKKAGLPPK